MSIYKMNYSVYVRGHLKNANMMYDFDLRLASKGVSIKKSINSISDTCSIFVPKRNPIKNVDNRNNPIFTDFTSEFIKRGDLVDIWLWYDNDLDLNLIEHPLQNNTQPLQHHRFYVEEVIIDNDVVELKCADFGYFCKITKINKDYGLTTLTNLMLDLITNVTKTVGEIEKIYEGSSNFNPKLHQIIPALVFPKPGYYKNEIAFKADNTNVLECVKTINKITGLNLTFISKTNIYTDSKNPTKNIVGTDKSLIIDVGAQMFDITQGSVSDNRRWYFTDVPHNILKPNQDITYNKIIDRKNLIWQNIDDVKIQIVCKIYDKNGNMVELKSQRGDSEGDTRTFLIYDNVNDFGEGKTIPKNIEEQNQDMIDAEILKYKYTGFKSGSSFTTFGFSQTKDLILKNKWRGLCPQVLDFVVLTGVGTLRPDSNMAEDLKNKSIFVEDSTYLIDTVEINFSSNGFRQTIGLGINFHDIQFKKATPTKKKNKLKSILKAEIDDTTFIEKARLKILESLTDSLAQRTESDIFGIFKDTK